MILDVKVVPRASEDKIIGWMPDGVLKVRLSAPPVDNKANEALVRLLAGALKVPKAVVRIRRGQGARKKQVEITGVRQADFPMIAKE